MKSGTKGITASVYLKTSASPFPFVPGGTKKSERLGLNSATTDPVSGVKGASKHRGPRPDLLVSSTYVLVASLTRDRRGGHARRNCRPPAVQERKHDEILLSPLGNHRARFQNVPAARMLLPYENSRGRLHLSLKFKVLGKQDSPRQ